MTQRSKTVLTMRVPSRRETVRRSQEQQQGDDNIECSKDPVGHG